MSEEVESLAGLGESISILKLVKIEEGTSYWIKKKNNNNKISKKMRNQGKHDIIKGSQ